MSIDMARLNEALAPSLQATLNEYLPSEIEANAIKPLPPLPVWQPSQFFAWTEPPGNHLLLPAYLSKGQLTTLIGQGGIGKTRLALWLAFCQILPRPWCGIETAGEPVKWLFLSDENGIARYQADLRAIYSTLTQAEIDRVEEFLRLPALLEPDDADLWLGNLATQSRIKATIETQQPGVIVFDPLQNLAPGDISKPGEMKEAVRLILSIVRSTAPQAAILVLHHARTGRQNIAQGVGWDAGNYGLGGKALFSAARCQMNLMPGSADDDTRLVLSCAKANNCPRFETRGLIFDPKECTYSVDSDFDAADWLADVEGRSRSGQSLCTVADVILAVQEGYTTAKALKEDLADAFATSKRTVERLIAKAEGMGGIKRLTRGRYILGPRAEKLTKSSQS